MLLSGFPSYGSPILSPVWTELGLYASSSTRDCLAEIAAHDPRFRVHIAIRKVRFHTLRKETSRLFLQNFYNSATTQLLLLLSIESERFEELYGVSTNVS